MVVFVFIFVDVDIILVFLVRFLDNLFVLKVLVSNIEWKYLIIK